MEPNRVNSPSRRRSRSWLLAVASLVAASAVAVPAAQAATVTVTAAADATVRSDQPDANFGALATLTADSLPETQSFLRFDVTTLTAPASRAKLRLRVTNGSASGPQVWAAQPGWDESAVTWRVRPVVTGAMLGNFGAVSAGFVEIDVSALVTGNGSYDIALIPDSNNGTDVASREAVAANRPQLVLETGGTPPPPLPGEPDADATVLGGSPDTNFGGSPLLQTDTSPAAESYLRFTVAGLTDTVRRATLRLFVTARSANGPEVWRVADGWDEGTLTYRDRPARLGTEPLDDLGTFVNNAWLDLDVTGAVTGEGIYSFGLIPDSSDNAEFSSREAATNQPRLIIETGTPTPPDGEDHAFAAMGDTGYEPADVVAFDNLRGRINQADPTFSVHVGDIKSSDDPCADRIYTDTRDRFNLFTQPLVFTPGDNEWRDCTDKVGRLDFLRGVFFPTNDSMGSPTMPLERQLPSFPENARWTRGPVVYATINMPGPNNNSNQPSEFGPRNNANLEWIRSTFDAATAGGSLGVVLFFQANPGFPPDQEDRVARGFADFMTTLKAETAAWGKPVVVVHGDTHKPRMDHPFANLPNLTRVEVTGPSAPQWWRIAVVPADPALFRIVSRD